MKEPDNKAILDYTKSVCPVCLKVLDARIVVKDKAVFLEKECPNHGFISTYIWPDVNHYQWIKSFQFPYKQPCTQGPSIKGCPEDCGLCSKHLRQPTLAEIEVTQHCNLRCPICFMAAEAQTPPADPDMSTIAGIYRNILTKLGPQTAIQLTGGEPTVRKNLPEIVRMGRAMGFNAIEINTNGVVIGQNPDFIQSLADAGISGIYLQFDGLNNAVYEKIRGKALLDYKLKAIKNCRSAGIQVVLAMTVVYGINHDQMGEVLDFALQNRDVIAGVAYQPAFISGRFDVETEQRLSMGDVAFLLDEQTHGMIRPYDLWPLGCSNPLCSSSTYIVEENGTFKPFTRMISIEDYMECFDSESPQGSIFADIAAKQYPELETGLAVVIMTYMDACSMDLNRLQECSMTVAMQDGRIVPFCALQLINTTDIKNVTNTITENRSSEKSIK